jgi:hypothetical protein
MGGLQRVARAAGTWASTHAWWLVAGLGGVVIALGAVALTTSDDMPLGTRVRGEQLSRPGSAGASTSTSSPGSPAAGADPAATTTTAAPGGATTPTARRGGAANRTSPSTNLGPGTPGTGAPSTLPPEIGPALTVTRMLDWVPGAVARQGVQIWAIEPVDTGNVARLDATGVRARGRVLPHVSGLAPVADGAWLLRSQCPTGAAELVHVDGAAAITKTVPIAAPIVCDPIPGRTGLAATPGALWIATADPARPGRGVLLTVSTATGAIVDRVAMAGVPHNVQTDGGSVWVTLSDAPGLARDDLVLRAFDAATRRQTREVVVRAPFGLPVVQGGDIWAGGASGLRRIPQAGGGERLYTTDGTGCGRGTRFGFVPAAATGATVWGTRLDLAGSGPTGPITQSSVCRIDVASGRTVGWTPGALRVIGGDDGGAWLADPGAGGLVRWSYG